MEEIFVLIIISLILIFIAVFLYCENNIIDKTYYKIKNEKVNKSIRIVHLSDLHSKPFKKVLVTS